MALTLACVFVTSAKEVMQSLDSICLFVCMLARLGQTTAQIYINCHSRYILFSHMTDLILKNGPQLNPAFFFNFGPWRRYVPSNTLLKMV